MAVSALWYGLALTSTFNKLADWDSDTVKTSLHTSTYSPSQDSNQFFSNTANELAATGNYAAGGATISPLTASYTGGTNTFALDGADAVWANLTMSAASRYAVVYDSTPGTAATNPLLMYVDFGADQTVSGATFTIQWAAGGLCSLTVS